MINLLSGIDATAAALNAERIRMDVVSQNISNSGITRSLDGKPYQRQQVVFEAVLRAQQAGLDPTASAAPGIRVARIEKDNSPPIVVHNPSHPHADSSGNVSYPNINPHREMVDLLAATRAYEANLAVVKNARAMALQTLSIGKR